MVDVRYFSGETQLRGYVRGMANAEFAAQFPNTTGRHRDSFTRMVMIDDSGALCPVDRIIEFKSSPSLHKCDDRCLHATRAVLSEVRDPFEMAERARWAEIAKRNALTPAQAKAADYRNGDLVRADDGDTDPYFTAAFR